MFVYMLLCMLKWAAYNSELKDVTQYSPQQLARRCEREGPGRWVDTKTAQAKELILSSTSKTSEAMYYSQRETSSAPRHGGQQEQRGRKGQWTCEEGSVWTSEGVINLAKYRERESNHKLSAHTEQDVFIANSWGFELSVRSDWVSLA